jgi:hypothetical protein
MSKGIAGTFKIANAMLPLSLNGASATHKFFPVNAYHRVLFHVFGSAASIADAVTMICQTMQATDAAGTGAKAVTNNVATATVPVGVVAANVTLLNAAAGSAITINGLTFTGAAATNTALRQFKADGNDAADCTALISCINDATYGVPGVTAAEGVNDSIDLTISEPGEATITITNADAVFTPIATAMEALVEVDLGALDIAGGFDHVGLRVTNSAAITTVTTAIFDGRYAPLQKVAAEKYDCEV